jgi:hypothetical protein
VDLLEREPFLRVLASEAASARQGDGRLVLISGAAGGAPAQSWLVPAAGCGEPATGC